MYNTEPERFLDAKTIERVENIALVHGAEGAMKARTYAIGDIHGMKDYLLNLLEFITETQKAQILYPSRFVFLGDYTDRGPEVAESIAVIRLLQELMPDGDVVALMGNHEDMFLQEMAFNEGYVRDNKPTADSFSKHGFRYNYPKDVIKWIAELPTSWEDERHYYVHAGFDPQIPVNKQSDQTKLWIRESFLHVKFNFGKHVFHGHTPRLDTIDQTEYRTNLDGGACFRGGCMIAAEIKTDRSLPVGFFKYNEDRKEYYQMNDDYRYLKVI